MNDIEQRIAASTGDKEAIIKIVKEVKLRNATMYIVDASKEAYKHVPDRTSVIIYEDGNLFQLANWEEGKYPKGPYDVRDYEWLTEDGRLAVMLNGQPRLPLGGARKGAGRKPLKEKRENVMITLSPKAHRWLADKAKETHKSMGSIIEDSLSNCHSELR